MTAFMPLAMEKDLRCDLMATGRGSLSIRCTGVQETIERQHRSWRLKTMEQEKGIWMLQLDVMSDASTILLNASFQCVHKTVVFRHKKGRPSQCPDFHPCKFLTVCTMHFVSCCYQYLSFLLLSQSIFLSVFVSPFSSSPTMKLE